MKFLSLAVASVAIGAGVVAPGAVAKHCPPGGGHNKYCEDARPAHYAHDTHPAHYARDAHLAR